MSVEPTVVSGAVSGAKERLHLAHSTGRVQAGPVGARWSSAFRHRSQWQWPLWCCLVGFALAPACTLDFDRFERPEGASGGTDVIPSASTSGKTCGNGQIDKGESCDPGIEAGEEGACPERCDDSDACAPQTPVGEASDCSARCEATPITESINGDGCCPRGASLQDDDDCDPNCNDGDVDPGETCDDGDGSKTPCPRSPEDCTGEPPDACHVQEVVGSNCRYICIEKERGVLEDGDGCCPTGASSITDSDCVPVCGNGLVERTETCDPASDEGCPTPESCVNFDDDPCTIDGFEGLSESCTARCVTTMTITEPDVDAADGCCPAGVPAGMDADCTASCTNGVLESGELCDDGPMSTKPCGDEVCVPTQSCEVSEFVRGEGDDYCRVECVTSEITACEGGDGCCPTSCTPDNDTDCSDACGNGVLDESKGEKCDKDIPAGELGACPTASDCEASSDPCSPIKFTGSADSCTAACEIVPVTVCDLATSDGCCSTERACNANNDVDCSAVCGNGAREAGELCDGNCESIVCDDKDPCTVDTLKGPECGKYCEITRITQNKDSDGCCLDGASYDDDKDCATVCGDGKVQGDEQCDTGEASPVACPRVIADCVESPVCTTSVAVVGEGCDAHCEYKVDPICQTTMTIVNRRVGGQ